MDIIVSCTQPLDEKEWDMLDEAVNASDGSLRNQGEGGKIIICQLTIQSLMMADEAVTAGLLPPPLTERLSSPLGRLQPTCRTAHSAFPACQRVPQNSTAYPRLF